MSKNSAFNRLWTANIFSNLADGFGKTAVPLLAVSLTKDPVLISLIGTLVMLPWLLFAVPIGTIIDSVNKKNALALANSIRALLAALLALFITLDFMTIQLLFIIAFVIGVCEVIADTASQTVVQAVVNSKDLEKANSKFEMTYTIIQDFVGAPIGGLLYAVAIAAPFIANGFGFAAAALLCFLIPIPFIKVERSSEKSAFDAFKSDLKSGISFLWNHNELKRLVLFTTSVAFFFSLSNATVILFVIEDLGLNPKHFGFFLTVTGVFSLIGAAIAPMSAKIFGRGRTMAVAISISTLAVLFAGLSPTYTIFLVPTCISVFTIVHWNILLMSTYQRLIPQDLFARVHGARRTLVWGSMPIASLIGGLVSKINLRLPFIIGGIAAFLITLFHYRFITRLGDKAMREE